jgi:thiol-disulfide isomerase/thioredoxin
MKRLVWGLLATTLCACSEPSEAPPPVPTSRSNAVAVTGKPQATPPPKPVATVAPPKAAPRALCSQRVDFAAPKGLTTARAASGASAPSNEPAFGVGKWVWLNLWAAWCGPCKEEMPRLLAFREKLRASGVLVDLAFVSLDDDERQFTRFLDAQPTGGVRASYWLPEGSGRSGFLASIGQRESVELPVQVFVSPAGRTTCVVEGAIEETDYASLASLLGAK